jgi:hypothetical protein
MLMKACKFVIAVALALLASGCVTNQQPVGDAKMGSGSVPKTRLIMANLSDYRAMPNQEEAR